MLNKNLKGKKHIYQKETGRMKINQEGDQTKQNKIKLKSKAKKGTLKQLGIACIYKI